MTKERVTEELENVLKKTRLKRPSEPLMAGYFSEVSAKIDVTLWTRSVSHFLKIGGVILLFVASGLGVWYFGFQPKPSTPSRPILAPSTIIEKMTINKTNSIQEKMEILSSLDSEWEEGSDLFLQGGDDLLEEALLLDELESSNAHAQTPLAPSTR